MLIKIETWIDELKETVDEALIMIVGNKMDL